MKRASSTAIKYEYFTESRRDRYTFELCELPTAEIVSFYRECGGRLLTVGSDAHHPQNMAKGFAETMEMIKSCDFDSIAVPTTKGILDFPVKG